MEKSRFYISTIAPDAEIAARAHGLGLEIAEYCTAYNMDMYLENTHATVAEKLKGVSGCTFHAPFNELFPCAIDPRARELARERYLQAAELASGYGADRLVIHGGYNERMYYPVWYTEKSAEFWREFMDSFDSSMLICLENVFEPAPDMLCDIVSAVGDERLGICLDIGHVNAYSDVPVMEWLEKCAPYIAHFHVHNNMGDYDSHSAPGDGTVDMVRFLERAKVLCPTATFALEVPEAEKTVKWLIDNGII